MFSLVTFLFHFKCTFQECFEGQGTLLNVTRQPGWEGSLGRVDTGLNPFSLHLKPSQHSYSAILHIK